MTLRGAPHDVVREAIGSADPLPGTRGFAGRLDGPNGPVLARDVLGRQPLYVERHVPPDEVVAQADPGDTWAFDPTVLNDPDPVSPGHVLDAEGSRELWTLPEYDPVADRERAVDDLETAVDAVLTALDGDPPVAFSGGVDSGLVATGSDGPRYVAGFPDSQDVAAAREGAAALDRELHVVELDHDAIERAAVAVAEATGRTNAMDVAIAIPLYLVAERVAADGYDRLAVGQGADELFGGYAKVQKAPEDPRVEADTVRGARDETLRSLPEQLPRDVLAIRAAGVEPVSPLLDDRVVDAALRLPEDLLVDGDRRKVALREVAGDRLPASIAERDKKALQYGSLVSRELDRLARQDGYKRRMDDHVTKYVESLVDDCR